MREASGWLLLALLLGHLGTHLSIAIGFAQAHRWRHAAIALWIAPLAPVWAWRAGMRRRCWAWAGSLAAYALVALAAR